MNIAIEARAIRAASGGIKSYAQNIIAELQKNQELTLDIITGAKDSATPLRSELLVPYWLSGPVAKHVRATNPDIAHFTKAAIPHKKYVPTVVTIYDVIPLLLPETQSFLRKKYWPKTLQYAATHADSIITISDQSKRDISRLLHVSESKITVTTLAVDATHFKPSPMTGTDPYILFVGTWDERKNIATLIRAFELIADKIPHMLIIAGKPAHKQDASQAYAQASVYADRIKFRENVPYDELPTLYGNADIFVWPSIYEGWGFPPQEAMACGTPVIVSNGGSLPEVVGDAGVIVPFSTDTLHYRLHDQDFTNNLAKHMAELIGDEGKKTMLAQKGFAQAMRTTWKDVAEKTTAVYTSLII